MTRTTTTVLAGYWNHSVTLYWWTNVRNYLNLLYYDDGGGDGDDDDDDGDY